MSGYDKPVSMLLKVVTCVPPEANVAPHVIDDAMELSYQTSPGSPSSRGVDVSLIQTRDVLSAMAVASKVLIAARRQRREQEAQLVLRNTANSYQPSVIAPDVVESAAVIAGATCTAKCLMVPTTCSRSMAEHLLDDLKVKYSSKSLLLLAIFAFPKETLQNPTSLAPTLARAIQLLPATASSGFMTGGKRPLFDENLLQGLHFGRARLLDGPFVELRGLVEYDALIDALFESRSFKSVLSMCSVQVTFKIVDNDTIGSAPQASLRPQSLCSCWYLHPKHHDEFAAAKTTSRHDVVESSNRHLNLTPTTQHFRLRAPKLDVVVVMALTVKELLAMSSFAHTLILGSGRDADLYIAPPTRTESFAFEARRESARVTNHDDGKGKGSVFDMDVVSDDLIEVQSGHSRSSSRHDHVQQALHLADTAKATGDNTIEESKLLQEIRRVGLEFDKAERRFQEAVAQRDVEKKQLAQDKRLLLEMRAELAAIAEDRSVADVERKELTLRLTEVHDELDRVERESAQLSDEKGAKARERREASSKAEVRRAEILRQQDEEVKKMMQDHREELQKRSIDHQRVAEADASTDQHVLEQLQREHERKKDEWRRAEEALTKLLATSTSLSVQLEELKGELTLQRRGLSDVEAKLRSCARQDISANSAHTVLGHEKERLDRRSSDAHKLRSEVEQKKKSLITLEHLAEQRQSELNELEIQLSNLRFEYNSSAASQDAEWRALTSELPQHFYTIEAFRRMQLRLEEDHTRLRLRHEEVGLWSTVLHATELHFVEAAKRECRENVFAYDSRFKALQASRTEAQTQLAKAQSKLDATRKQHKDMDEEMRRHLITARDEERSLTAFVEGRAMPSTGSQFPSLVQDEQRLSLSIGRIRECLSSGCIVLSARGAQEMSDMRAGKQTRNGLDETTTRPFPMAASRSKAFHVAVADLREQLEFLVEATKEDCEKAILEHKHLVERLIEIERDLDERKAILDRAVLQTSLSEKNLAVIAAASGSKTEEIVERKRQHEVVRKHLQEEFVLAQETSSRHRRDGLTHLRQLKAHEDALQQQVSAAVSDLTRVQGVLDSVTAKNPEGTVAALRLRIEREKQRHDELKEVIEAEMALMPRRSRMPTIKEDQEGAPTQNPMMTPRPGNRGSTIGILSPAL